MEDVAAAPTIAPAKPNIFARFFGWLFKTIFGAIASLAVSAAIVAGIIWYLNRPTPQPTALEIVSGTATVNLKPGKTGDVLQNGDVIKTGKSSEAVVTFPNASEIRLDENSEIKINTTSQSKISIFQTIGTTWSRVIKLTGYNAGYEIETPTAVATVRGTAFSTVVDSDTGIDTDDGSVDVLQKTSKKKLLVEAGFGTKASKLQKEAIREDLKNSAWFRKNRERDRKILERLQQKGVKPGEILDVVRSVNPQDLMKVKNLIQKAQGGKLNLSESQKQQLEPIAQRINKSGGKVTPYMDPDLAAALAIIDSENFSDTAHWSQTLRAIIPLIEKFQLLRLPSTE